MFKKIIFTTALILGLAFPVSAYVQPEYFGFSKIIKYFDKRYFARKSFTGVAGFKTIDKMVRLKKTVFESLDGQIINLVQIVRESGRKDIVGYGIKVYESEFSLEDSNCDGVMDKVGLYNDPVFPPDCWDRETI